MVGRECALLGHAIRRLACYRLSASHSAPSSRGYAHRHGQWWRAWHIASAHSAYLVENLWNGLRGRVVLAAIVVLALAVILALIWSMTDVLAAHDVGLIKGSKRAAARYYSSGFLPELHVLGADLVAWVAAAESCRDHKHQRRSRRAAVRPPRSRYGSFTAFACVTANARRRTYGRGGTTMARLRIFPVSPCGSSAAIHTRRGYL